MICPYCGAKVSDSAATCPNCANKLPNMNEVTVASGGTPKPVAVEDAVAEEIEAATLGKKSNRIVSTVIILIIIGVNIFNGLDGSAVNTNNNAINSYELGNGEAAITQFKQAAEDAVTTETKITTLKNLGYAYDAEGRNEEAIDAFQRAFALTTIGSFEHNLIGGQIAELKGDPAQALISYKLAYEQDPKDFQVNNSLALFYMDITDVHPSYVDYPQALVHAKKADEVSELALSKKNLAVAHFFNGNFNDTIFLYESADISQEPFSHYILGLAYVEMENPTRAVKHLKIAIEGGIEAPLEIVDYVKANSN